jgi:hypothetical protein
MTRPITQRRRKAAFVPVGLLLLGATLSACSTLHGVRRCVPLPADWDPRVRQATAERHSLREHARDWDGDCLWVSAKDGDANASIQCWRGELEVCSAWLNRDPEPAVLQRSLELQREFILLLRERFAWIPEPEAWPVEWLHMQPPPIQP